MSAQRWARVEDLFSRALAANPNERQRLVADAAADDDMLRAAVESLLGEHAREPAFLEQVPTWLDAPAALPDTQPERLGPYRILKTLGRGGMGTVYLAERETPEFRQQVALKVVRRGIDTDDVIARFRAEREILASLDHPNISRFLDVGTTDSGAPFLVMEYVDGMPILKFCDRNKLTVAERCELFRGICAAVHHAHRSLVVHRDIKPSNVLVTPDRVPKLLDFGIAKVLGPGGRAGESPRTGRDVRVLTPEYAAPEQIRGEVLTTACDVYALGVLLYELISGCHPLKTPAARDDVRRSILEVDPPAPSIACRAESAPARGVTPTQLRRQLAGDLDTIVLKALRKEPQQRYASALSLSEDIERHFKGIPVLARPTSARYRLGKFVRRNRVAVLGTAALLALFGAASTVTWYQSRRIAAESVRVTRERDKALEVRSFLLEMFGATGPDQPADAVTARQLLDRRAADLKRTHADDPEMRAEMMYVLSEGYEKLSLPAQAEPLAREALQLRRQVFGDRHPDVAASLNLLGWIRRQRADLTEAERHLREAIAVGRAVFPAEGDTRLARALNDLGVVRADAADYREARTLYDESLTMRKRLLGERHLGVAITTSNLAVVLLRQQDLNGAVAMARSALTRFRELLGEEHQRTASAKENLATMLSMQGDHEASAALHREILESRKRTLGARHPLVATSMTMVANQMRAFKQYAQAESLLVAALGILREAHGPRHNTIASTLRVLGDVKYDAGRPADALKDYGMARDIAEALGVSGRNELGIVRRRSARAREALGDHAGAEHDLREFVRVARLAPTPSIGLEAEVFLLEFLVRRGRAVEGKALLTAIEAKPESTLSRALRQRVTAARRELGT